MKLEELKNKTKDAVDYLVQSLESGHGEVLTQGFTSTRSAMRSVYCARG